MDDFGSWEEGFNPYRLRSQALGPLARHSPARYQAWDWNLRRFGPTRLVEPAEFVIVEGVSSSRKELSDILGYRIWVDAPRDMRLARGLERDGQKARPLWDKWAAWEEDYVHSERPDQRADIIADGAPSLSYDPESELVRLAKPRRILPGNG
jgi:uridine kinase